MFKFYDYGGTLVRFGKFAHIDVRTKALLSLAHNARWINWVGKAGVDIIDIGICGNNSVNYLMEILHIGKWLF